MDDERLKQATNRGTKSSKHYKIKNKSPSRTYFWIYGTKYAGLIFEINRIVRAPRIIGLINLTYNLFRYEQVVRLNILKT